MFIEKIVFAKSKESQPASDNLSCREDCKLVLRLKSQLVVYRLHTFDCQPHELFQ